MNTTARKNTVEFDLSTCLMGVHMAEAEGGYGCLGQT